VLLTAAFGAAAAEPAQAPDDQGAAWYAAYDRGSRQVPLPEGRTLNLYCLGRGSPTVILESGLGSGAYTWWKVQDRIGKFTRVCAYDRAGYGKSPMGPLPRDTTAHVSDLEALLKAGAIRGPYVVVGHSMGGYIARLFASLHTADVVGMVLVDPAVENQLAIMEPVMPTIAKGDASSRRYMHYCADPKTTDADFEKDCVRAAPKTFPPALAAKFVTTRDNMRTFGAEGDAFFDRDSFEVIAQRRSFGAMPLVILTRGELSTNIPRDEAETEHRMWTQLHDQVAQLSTRGSNRTVEGSGHYIQLDKPDAVVSAVAEVVRAARAKRP
jgi:pimeloyl-ACP methyl ester carboxylesterase